MRVAGLCLAEKQWNRLLTLPTRPVPDSSTSECIFMLHHTRIRTTVVPSDEQTNSFHQRTSAERDSTQDGKPSKLRSDTGQRSCNCTTKVWPRSAATHRGRVPAPRPCAPPLAIATHRLAPGTGSPRWAAPPPARVPFSHSTAPPMTRSETAFACGRHRERAST